MKHMKAVAFGILLLAPVSAAAADYPSKPITMIVPYAAGSGTDSMARVVSEALSKRLKQRIIVDNRPGAGGTLGAAALARAAPDGYTLGIGNSATHASSMSLLKTVPYDPAKDFVPIARLGSFIFMLAVNSKVPVNSVPELIAYSKANPKELTFAYANNTALVVYEWLKASHGFQATAVPYKAMPQAVVDVVSGRISSIVVDVGPVLPYLESKVLRPLMLTTRERSRLQPDIPSSQEAGTKIHLNSWGGVFAPAGTPPVIVDQLAGEIKEVVSDPKVSATLARGGYETIVGDGKSVLALLKDDVENWRNLVAAIGIEPR